MTKLQWGVLGCASIAVHKVIPAMQRSQHGEVVAIGSRDAERAAQTAAQLGIARSHGSYEDVLADDGVDAVYIPLPNHLHAEWTRASCGGRQTRAVREAARPRRRRGGRDDRSVPSGGCAADGGVHVPPPPVMAADPRARRVGHHWRATGHPGSVHLLQRRPAQHSQRRRLRRRGSDGHRVLSDQRRAVVLRRRTDPSDCRRAA